VLGPKLNVQSNRYPKIALAGTLIFLAYCGLRGSQSEQGPATLVDYLVIYPAVFLIFGVMAVSTRRAYFARSKFWMFAPILFWPLCFVYTLAINKGSKDDEYWWQDRR
jgi:hypothetical protein